MDSADDSNDIDLVLETRAQMYTTNRTGYITR